MANVRNKVDKLKALNGELSSGTSAVVALVANGRLFVANVGDSRALLCRTDANNVLKVVQLSVDHDLSNEDELLRLYNLGLDIDKLTKGSRLGNEENTRCIGNFLVKGAYKEFEDLAIASTEPVIAEPEIHGGIQLDDSCRFLLLMSDGLYKSLQEARGTDQVNKEIAQMVDAEFRVQSTLTGVAQAVVDKIVRVHHDASMSCSGGSRCGGGKRDDITLLLRNFNYPLPHSATVRFDNNPQFNYIPANCSHSDLETQSSGTGTTRSDDTTSSEAYTSGFVRPERIPAYVDFSEFYRNVDMARQAGTLPPEIDF